MIVALLLACRPSEVDPGPGSGWDHPVARSLRAGVPGFEVEEGRQQVFGGCEQAIEELGHCLGNNPATPYVTLYFGDYDELFGVVRLDPDEAVVWLGRTPREARYFSFTAAVHERLYDAGWDTPVGSVAGSLHHRNVRHDGPAVEPFDRLTAIVATGDRRVAAEIRRELASRLAAEGVGPDVVNVVEIPMLDEAGVAAAQADPSHAGSTVVRLRPGHEQGSDGFSFGWRLADGDPDDPFLDGDRAQAAIFRFTPHVRSEPSPWDWPHLPPLRDVENTPPQALLESLRVLTDAVLEQARASGLEAVRDVAEETNFSGFRCIELGIRCGNSDDAWYAATYPVLLPVDLADAGITLIGVVHPDVRQTLGAGPSLAYANLNVQHVATAQALDGWFHDELRGSARAMFPAGVAGIPEHHLDLLFAVDVRRDCGSSSSPCLELSTDLVPDGDTINVLERAYLDLSTGTGPHRASILASRQVVHGPRVVPRLDAGWIEVQALP
jgi:hypothetical protein